MRNDFQGFITSNTFESALLVAVDSETSNSLPVFGKDKPTVGCDADLLRPDEKMSDDNSEIRVDDRDATFVQRISPIKNRGRAGRFYAAYLDSVFDAKRIGVIHVSFFTEFFDCDHAAFGNSNGITRCPHFDASSFNKIGIRDATDRAVG